MPKSKKKSSSQANRAKRINLVRKRIMPASKRPKVVRALVYGRSGKGKTRLVSSAPDVLLIDVNDEGWDSVRKDYDPDTFDVKYWQEINDIYWYLAAGDHPYKTVAVDGVSALQNLCMKFVLGDEASRDASRDPDMPSRPAYGKVGELMKTQITNFRNLPMNVVFTALERNREIGEDEDDLEIETGPNCTPSVGSALEAAVALIGRITKKSVVVKTKGGKRKRTVKTELLVGPSDRYVTKERYHVFDHVVKSPNLTEMFQRIYEEGTVPDEEA